MTLAERLRAQADFLVELDSYIDFQRIAENLRNMADEAEGKVLVRPRIITLRTMYGMNGRPVMVEPSVFKDVILGFEAIHSEPVHTEAEALADLQRKADGL